MWHTYREVFHGGTALNVQSSSKGLVDIHGDVFYTCNAKLVFSTVFSTDYFVDI